VHVSERPEKIVAVAAPDAPKRGSRKTTSKKVKE
jgi:hypothetical protein